MPGASVAPLTVTFVIAGVVHVESEPVPGAVHIESLVVAGLDHLVDAALAQAEIDHALRQHAQRGVMRHVPRCARLTAAIAAACAASTI